MSNKSRSSKFSVLPFYILCKMPAESTFWTWCNWSINSVYHIGNTICIIKHKKVNVISKQKKTKKKKKRVQTSITQETVSPTTFKYWLIYSLSPPPPPSSSVLLQNLSGNSCFHSLARTWKDKFCTCKNLTWGRARFLHLTDTWINANWFLNPADTRINANWIPPPPPPPQTGWCMVTSEKSESSLLVVW